MTTGIDAAAPEGMVRLGIRPLGQLSMLAPGHWEATGDDPQMALDLPEPIAVPGIYRIVVQLAGAVVRPCLYLDFGEGWSESTTRFLEPAGDGAWTALLWLPGLAGVQRFDPSERPGRFGLGEITLERVPEGQAILLLLGRETAAAPDLAACLTAETTLRAARDGLQATCGWLLEGGARSLRKQATPYLAWIAAYDGPDAATQGALREAVARLPRRPLVSLLLPADGVRSDRLAACVESVLAQAYPDWELCIVADEASASPDARRLLAGYRQSSSRIRILPPIGDDDRDTVLERIGGDYVASLAGAQRLPSHALLAFVEAVVSASGARIVYSDSDRIDDDGVRSDPWFRPEWNPDLFLSHDYLAGAVVVESSLLRESARARAGRDPIADALVDCIANAGSDPVHLPFVLWHWPRDFRPQGDPQARVASLRRTLDGAHLGIRVEATDSGVRLRWPLPVPVPKVSLVVPTRDRVALLRRCVGSILELTTYPDYEIVVVDNQSVEPETLDYFAELESQPRVRLLRHDEPFNYAAINNRAVADCHGEVIGLVNNDLEVITPGWLEEMVSHAVRPGIGAVGAMLYYPDDTIQHAGVVIGLGGVAGHVYSRQPRGVAGAHGRAALVQNLSAVTAACLLVRKAAFLEVGGMDERLTVAFNDVDFCLRLLERGYRNVWTPFAEFYHHESATRGDEDTPEKLARFHAEVGRMIETWSDRLAEDPAYSPNLSLEHGNALALAWPPRRIHPLHRWSKATAMHPEPHPASPAAAQPPHAPIARTPTNDGSTQHA